MPRCQKCKKDWPADTVVCPDDGYSFTLGVDATVAPKQKPMATAVLAAGIGEAAAAAVQTQQRAELAPLPEMDENGELVAGMMVGEYKIDKKIGEGGMGAVYSATHPMIGKRAAIKVISAALGADPSAVNRFVQEARSVNQIGHPNIVDVFAFGELADGRNYFVMEYLQGHSLADRLETPIALGEAIEVLDQVADALEAAHEKQIVHRDLKPDNVYLAAVRGGRTLVKLLDFGIAKLSTPESSAGGVAKTRTGMMMGTPGYLSPEQARGRNVDHRTDIYALGCMIFEIVCGRLPFVADNAMDMVLMHMTQAPEKPSQVWADIPPPLDALIFRMLDKNPDERPTLGEIRACFSELISSGLVTLDNKRGVAFRSGLRSTPATGVPLPTHTSAIAVGTELGGKAPPASAIGTTPPIAGQLDAPPAKKKTMLYVAIAGAVAVFGAIAIVIATSGGGKPADPPPPPIVAKAPEVVPSPPPTPTPPPVTVDAAVAVVAAKGGTIAITVKDKTAKVELDGSPVTLTGDVTEIAVDRDGSHTLVVTAPGKQRLEQKLDVAGGAKVPFEAKLDKLGSTVTAIKHPPVGNGSAKPPTAGSGSAAVVPVKKPDDGVCDPFAPGAKC